MGRLEEPVADGPLKAFAEDLRVLRRETGMTYRVLSRRAGYSYSVLSAAASGAGLPTLAVTLAYVGACGGNQDAWEARWNATAALLRATQPGLLPPDTAGQSEQQATGPVEIDEPAAPHTPAAARAHGTRSDGVGAGDGWREQFEPLGTGDPVRIGPYRTLGRLGGGAMGEVYLAASPTGRAVAVKLILVRLARDPLFRRRFAKEVAAARAVTGGHSPALVDADVNAERPWMATAYVPGPSLGDVVTAHGPLPEPVVAGLAAGVAEGLQSFHAAGIVHRDLKPSNILLADEGPKVIDFGISRALEGTSLTATGAQVGTAGFMAPEQAEGRDVTGAADVFALGCVLAYAATGVVPFGEGPSAGVLYRVVHDAPAKEALACQDKQLRALIEACLHKDPLQRPSPAQIVERCAASARIGPGWLPAAPAAQIARRSAHAAALIARGTRARAVRRTRIALACLVLVLAVAAATVLLERTTPRDHAGASSAGGNPRSSAGGGASTGGTGPGTGLAGGQSATPGGNNPGANSGSSDTSGVNGQGSGNPTPAPSADTTAPASHAGSPAAPAAPPPALTAKFSFEKNSADNWSAADDSDVSLNPSTTVAHDGSGSLSLTDSAVQAGTYVNAISPALSDGPAAGSMVSAWIYVPAGSAQVHAHLYTQDGAGHRSTSTDKALSTGWNNLSFSTSLAAVRVGAQFTKGSAPTTTVYLDQVDWS